MLGSTCAASQSVRERFAFKQFEHETNGPVRIFHAIDLRNVAMILL
jgi:hypothetical protein